MNYNPFSLTNRTILITGASSGIGQATAIECSRLGARVVIAGRDKGRLEQTYGELEGTGHLQFCVDLLNEEQIGLFLKELPVLNGIVHSAGVADTTLFRFITEQKLKEVFDINFYTPVVISNRLLRLKKIEKGASVVFLSSIDGPVTGHAGNGVYAATKGAISGIIKSMAVELATRKIRVNAVLPGQIETPLIHSAGITEEQLEMDRLKYPLKRYGTPREVAWAIIYLLSEASSFTTGSQLVVDGGVTLL